jgi:uncharacterized protein
MPPPVIIWRSRQLPRLGTQSLERRRRLHRSRNDVLFLLEKGRIIPALALVERVARMLDGNEEFDLLDTQNEAFQVIRHAIAGVATAAKRQVFIVHGGPGTGKSVIAVWLLAEVLASKRLGFFIVPNKAFRNTLVEQLARGASMVEDMVRAARISVFFLDETQRVQWNDSGSESRIREAATKFKAHVHPPFTLTAQFRCGGSDGYLNWLDDVLQFRPTGNFDNWADEQYDFRVFDDATELYRELTARNAENKAHLVAGYSWDWPTEGRQRRGHAKHVTVNGLSLPWHFSGENWATATDSIEQVGFDWLGVLIGPDLRFEDGRIVGDPDKQARTDNSLKGSKKSLREAKDDHDATEAVLAKMQAIIKNTYKVLLSRGRKGCFVWCADAALG